MCEADGLLLEVVADADEVKVAGYEDQCLLHVPLFVQGQHLKIMYKKLMMPTNHGSSY